MVDTSSEFIHCKFHWRWKQISIIETTQWLEKNNPTGKQFLQLWKVCFVIKLLVWLLWYLRWLRRMFFCICPWEHRANENCSMFVYWFRENGQSFLVDYTTEEPCIFVPTKWNKNKWKIDAKTEICDRKGIARYGRSEVISEVKEIDVWLGFAFHVKQ